MAPELHDSLATWPLRLLLLGKARMILVQILQRIGTDCVALQAFGFLYILLPFFDGLCHTPLATFFLCSTVLEFVHDEASGFGRHCMGSVW